MSPIKHSLNKHCEDLWETCLCNVAYFLKTHIKEIKEFGQFKVGLNKWKYLTCVLHCGAHFQIQL